ncbi:response regulator [Leptospira sp. 2 VSF19]|uniref:Response regulator n=1 Tax=Leptospira soteropolitanensis TaxID=2950025 RepID=A0AAW5VE18_9LEPT|nr:response regulator [Leptospira soteropolitanensis]MCW7491928.1 response regulator [Leptospira soteropolitanensis]MCW7499512.1 response regulator [Leptospira soteropolitanensis]MCW7520897.1 response regulator [Leptospira soteropolitanensis]MCW7525616.1 response regulator [Leptospira soteropolitanensis]MCW7529482.1 response regulator [Leptospira soteropolitanensis]
MTKILLIEDEPGIQETIQITLESEGFFVTLASTGKQGIQLLSKDLSLIILDIGLPDQNGFEVLKEIRKRQQTPVIFLTARNTEIDKVLGLEIGADDYIVKPFSPRELLARIRAIFRRTIIPQSIEESKFSISLDKKLVYLNGKTLNLSPYEYKTLELFFRWPGRIFTREEIMDSVWTEPEDSFDRAVDTVIKNIRARIKELEPDFDPIETRRGQGYGLKEKI